MELRSIIPVGVGLFAVLASICDWNWFFGQISAMSPLRLAVGDVWVRRILRVIVACMGLAVAVIASLFLLGFDV